VLVVLRVLLVLLVIQALKVILDYKGHKVMLET
jgi:hypothetical protein